MSLRQPEADPPLAEATQKERSNLLARITSVARGSLVMTKGEKISQFTEFIKFMLSMNELKIGTFFKLNNEPYVVLSTQHVQMGRGGAILRTKMKNLLTGNVFERTFKSGDQLDETDIEKVKANYLYSDDEFAHFMEIESYDQFQISKAALGDKFYYLKEDTAVEVLKFDGQPLNINLPPKMTLKVAETSEAVRGDTAQGNITKEATLENGLTIKVPHFVKQGEDIIVNTETGEYAERAAKK